MSEQKAFRWTANVLVSGRGSGKGLLLPEPLSLWGGLDPHTGEIIDRRHPCSGENATGRVMILPGGRGSSSASSILLESVRENTAPAAIITLEADPILALGAVVARELYSQSPPVVVLEAVNYQDLSRHVLDNPNALIEVDDHTISMFPG